MDNKEIIPHLFRIEFRKIVSVLGRLFGFEQIETAEDIAGETFLTALQTWPHQGIPDNPTAWLYAVAKNKAINHLKRRRREAGDPEDKVTESAFDPEIDLSDSGIADSQLQMLFAVCHPSLSSEGQIALALRILCGFGIEEIANAFLTSKETINKRLFRAKEKLKQEKVKIVFPPESETGKRLDSVLTVIYLLFNEGYYSESHDAILREELCLEAMRLGYLLVNNSQTDSPDGKALIALMCFHASRFPARKNIRGEAVLYYEQDETLWDSGLIAKGAYYLHEASQGSRASKYHLEATIAYWHTIKEDSAKKWTSILRLYDQLLATGYSPVAAMNRIFAFSKVHGNEKAIAEAEKLNLAGNRYYYTLLGELYAPVNALKAAACFEKALQLAGTEADKRIISDKIANLRTE